MGRKEKIIHSVQLHDITHQGLSVGRAEDGMVIFVQGGVPGDVADVMITRKRKESGMVMYIRLLLNPCSVQRHAANTLAYAGVAAGRISPMLSRLR